MKKGSTYVWLLILTCQNSYFVLNLCSVVIMYPEINKKGTIRTFFFFPTLFTCPFSSLLLFFSVKLWQCFIQAVFLLCISCLDKLHVDVRLGTRRVLIRAPPPYFWNKSWPVDVNQVCNNHLPCPEKKKFGCIEEEIGCTVAKMWSFWKFHAC